MATRSIVLRPTWISRIALVLVAGAALAIAVVDAAWIAGATIAAATTAAWIAIARRSVIVDDDGVRATNLLGTRALAWNEIEAYRYWSAFAGRAVSLLTQHDPRIAGASSHVHGRRHELVVR